MTTCARCGRGIAPNSTEDLWEDGDGYAVCHDWTGHDRNGIYAPSHHPQADMCAAEDITAYEVHADADGPCWRCTVEDMGVLDAFRAAASKEDLAVMLLDAALAVSSEIVLHGRD